MEQQSQEWFDARVAHITSSEFHNLMGVRSLGDTAYLPDTAKTYIRGKYAELTTGLVPEIKAWTLDWGKENEPLAQDEFEKRNGAKLTVVGFVQHKEHYYFGGSPDGFIVIDGINHNVEIKCPATTSRQYNNIGLSFDQTTMKRKYPELYWQMVCNMMLLTNRGYPTDKSIFVSFDKRIKIGKGQYFQCIIDKLQQDVYLVEQQLAKAWELYKSLGENDGVDVAYWLHPDNQEERKKQYIDTTVQDAKDELAALELKWQSEKNLTSEQ